MMRVKIRSSASTTKIASLTSSLILAAGPFMSLKTGNGWYSTTKFLTFNRRDHLRQEEEGRGVKTSYSVKCFLSSVWVKLIVSLKFGFLFSWFLGQGGPKISCTTTQTLPNLRLPISSLVLSPPRTAPLRFESESLRGFLYWRKNGTAAAAAAVSRRQKGIWSRVVWFLGDQM